MSARTVMYAVLGGLALSAPLLGLYPVFLMKLLCFAMSACAFNLLLGYTKMLSFGHAAYFGASAYVTGWLATARGWGTIEAILGGVAAAALLGFVIGAIAVRRQGIYFAMITLALSQLVFFVCLQADFTGGENGLQGIPRGSVFGAIGLGRDLWMYYFVLAVFAAVYALIHRIVHSPFGQILKAIRANEPRAVSLGYKVDRYKLEAFVLSASLAGLAGSLKALVLGFVTLQEYLSDLVGAWVSVIVGAIFVVCVMTFRLGLVGEIQRRFARRAAEFARTTGKPPAAH
jgi:branched-chain amino acid transport system permease protein